MASSFASDTFGLVYWSTFYHPRVQPCPSLFQAPYKHSHILILIELLSHFGTPFLPCFPNNDSLQKWEKLMILSPYLLPLFFLLIDRKNKFDYRTDHMIFCNFLTWKLDSFDIRRLPPTCYNRPRHLCILQIVRSHFLVNVELCYYQIDIWLKHILWK